MGSDLANFFNKGQLLFFLIFSFDLKKKDFGNIVE
jgi:uncharacterized protein YwqG